MLLKPLIGIALASAILLAGRAEAEAIHVFAASSLQPVLEEIGRSTLVGTGDTLVATYAASSTLARQIEQGAPADIFISADMEWMDYLATRSLVVEASRRNIAANRLVLIAPSGQSGSFGPASTPEEALGLLGDGRIALGAVGHVPAGRYAKAALTKLGLWDAIAGRLVETENVRSALTFVVRGEVPLGIVYQSDAVSEPKVVMVGLFPDDSHAPIVYPAALVTDRPNAAARRFLDLLTTPEAQALFTRFGFSPLPTP
ncbi:MAG: molybdate ABC transporter substrate-binding protein [Hyphomicrobiaceae bacterium]